MSEFISSSIAIAALLLGAYFVFRKEGREDGQTAAHRLARIEAELASQKSHGQEAYSRLEVELANQKFRQQGFQAEIENVADHSKRERQAIVENANRDHNALREMIKDVPTMRDLVYRVFELGAKMFEAAFPAGATYKLEIVVFNAYVSYQRDGVEFYRSTVTPTLPLYAEACFYNATSYATTGGYLSGVLISATNNTASGF